ncbi:hypothetical protein JP75_15230 [Devosia riboflavina]|uniref:Uncharacterized protein n=1 Tax=Devosia riboflavina TaxID=46914 RepID=A0A087M099_9HYPH|nr:DUF6886 family protein [Devosia riboflavina]KFL30302.1 hypothetical protein JP75_15230 [Devosia riboflavina]
MKLFHLSDDPAIARFEPRPSAYTEEPVVWAISDQRIANYLLPRDCPRVCFRAGHESSAEDVERFLGDSRVVIAIEEDWLERLAGGKLHRYAMPSDGFVLKDEGAGYWVSYGAIEPLDVEVLDDLPGAIAAEGVTLKVLPSLWALHDGVKASSLVFSMIRMRNAGART